jgi:lysophospholipase
MLGSLPATLLALLLVFADALRSNAQSMGSPDDYAPQMNVECPNVTETPLLRIFTPETQTLNALEEDYVSNRQQTTIPNAWRDWLGDGSKIGYNLSDFEAVLPRIGLGISGGGYRAAQYGAGVLSGLDSRNESAKAAGTGGLLQVASYISALSGAW